MFEVTPANKTLLTDVLAWLERESLETNEGFFCKKDVILESFANGELYCALLEEQAIGFVVHTLKSAGSSIDILEVHPAHRGKGFGARLARHAIAQLFNAGAAFVTVKCAPKSSESFWRALGFTSTTQSAASSFEPPQLMLRNATQLFAQPDSLGRLR